MGVARAVPRRINDSASSWRDRSRRMFVFCRASLPYSAFALAVISGFFSGRGAISAVCVFSPVTVWHCKQCLQLFMFLSLSRLGGVA
jgi:hypothetical protein